MKHIYNDGGRAAAGYRGETGDCVCRAIAIAMNLPYRAVYDDLIRLSKQERPRKRGRHSHPRTGIFYQTARKYIESFGWVWIPTMQIGSGCRVHLRPDELPPGRLIVSLSKHYAAVIDGVIYDTLSNVDRDGNRCVYGYFAPPGGGSMDE